MSAPNEPAPPPVSTQLDSHRSAPPNASESPLASEIPSEDEEPDEEAPEEAAAATALPDEALEATMSPEASPWRSQKMNRRPLIVVGLLVVGVCALMAYAMLERYADSATDNPLRADADEPALPRGTDSRRMADDIIGQPHIGLIPDAVQAAPAPPTELAPEAKVPITSVVDEPVRPAQVADTERSQPKPSQEDEQWHQARVSALREALVAPRTIRFDHRPAEPSQGDFVQRELARVAQQRAALGGAVDPATAYQQAAAQAAKMLGAQPSAAHASPMAGGMSGPMPGSIPGGMPFAGFGTNAGPPPSSNARNDLRAYDATSSNERWILPNRVEPAASPYMLLPGDIIPSVLDSAINSELPGHITGHVAQPVYSATGRHELLVPAGTKLFGQYSADVVFGQNRLLVAWQLLRFPDGSTIDIGAMPGTDGVGRAGLADQVDNHYLRLFTSALLLSLVTTGVTMAQAPSSSGPDRMSVSGAMSQALGLQFGQVTAQLLQKNLNVAPTLDIGNGFRFHIVVTKKITFPGPYRGNP